MYDFETWLRNKGDSASTLRPVSSVVLRRTLFVHRKGMRFRCMLTYINACVPWRVEEYKCVHEASKASQLIRVLRAKSVCIGN